MQGRTDCDHDAAGVGEASIIIVVGVVHDDEGCNAGREGRDGIEGKYFGKKVHRGQGAKGGVAIKV